MSIEVQLFLITGTLAALIGYAAYIEIRLAIIYRWAKSSIVGAVTLVLLGLRQLYTFGRLHWTIAEAKERGVMIESLNWEQWIVGVFWALAIAIGLVLWLSWKRRDLKRELGI